MIKLFTMLSCALLFAASGCGGGGGTSLIVSGTASEGALITGKTVTLQDANGSATYTTTDATTGSYSINVTGLTAPFLVTVTGTNGTYISLAQTDGTANINPVTTMVVALAAGTCDVSALFTNLTSEQLTTINTNYAAKCALITASLQAVLPAGVKAEDYFTGTVTAGTGMDAIFDTYQFSFHPTDGITVKTKDASATTVLTIPVATVTANTNQPLPTINAAPVANAGTAQSVVVGTVVTLDGSGSSDANGDLLTYSWAFTSKPNGSSAALSSATAVNPTFTADVAGTYVLSLVVNDGAVNSAAATVSITVTVANAAPVANAGSTQSVVTGTFVTLDGSGSSDANGDLLTYTWAFTSKPSGSSAALTNPTGVKPAFTPDVAGTYVISLIVNDGKINSNAATVTVTASVDNAAPVANAGIAQSVVTGTLVTLDGSGSSDANGDLLTYSWAFTSKPAGSSAILSSATIVNPAFTPDIAGAYVLNLVVNDGKVNSAAATVTITASYPLPSGFPITFKGIELQSLTFTTDTIGCKASLTYKNTNNNVVVTSLTFDIVVDGVIVDELTTQHQGLQPGATVRDTVYVYNNGGYRGYLACGTFTLQFNAAASFVTITASYPLPSGFPITFKGIKLQSLTFTTDTIGCKASLTYKNTNIEVIGTSLNFDIVVGRVIVGNKDIQHQGLQPGATVRDTFYVYNDGSYLADGTFTLQFNAAASFLF